MFGLHEPVKHPVWGCGQVVWVDSFNKKGGVVFVNSPGKWCVFYCRGTPRQSSYVLEKVHDLTKTNPLESVVVE